MTKKPPKARADTLLVRASIATNEAEARALIMTGRVMALDVSGREKKVEKPGERLDETSTFRLAGRRSIAYASRAGYKLEAALEAFGIDVAGRVCADIGISTGGFTDCLLQHGALRVHGVDVGYGQVDWRIRNDPRLKLYERTNVRHLPPGAFGEAIDLVVIDVSFISLRLVLPAILGELAPDGEILALLKPQFEVERDEVPGGIVQDPEARRRVVVEISQWARSLGLDPKHEMESPVRGADGNVEHLLHLTRAGESPTHSEFSPKNPP